MKGGQQERRKDEAGKSKKKIHRENKYMIDCSRRSRDVEMIENSVFLPPRRLKLKRVCVLCKLGNYVRYVVCMIFK